MRKGFILVEWMIQFLLCSLIAVIAFSLFRTWSSRLYLLHKSLNAALQLPIATDALRRDIHAAQSNALEISPDQCVCMRDNMLIKWRFKEGTLYRIQKKYDPTQKSWRKSTHNVAAEQVAGWEFEPLYDTSKIGKQISGVRIIRAGQEGYVIGLRNGKQI